MDDWRLKIPPIDDVSIAFGGYPDDWFQSILDMPEDKEWAREASMLFFRGGSVNVNADLEETYRFHGLRMLKCVLASFKPKHEHKEHVAGLILKSLCMK